MDCIGNLWFPFVVSKQRTSKELIEASQEIQKVKATFERDLSAISKIYVDTHWGP